MILLQTRWTTRTDEHGQVLREPELPAHVGWGILRQCPDGQHVVCYIDGPSISQARTWASRKGYRRAMVHRGRARLYKPRLRELALDDALLLSADVDAVHRRVTGRAILRSALLYATGAPFLAQLYGLPLTYADDFSEASGTDVHGKAADSGGSWSVEGGAGKMTCLGGRFESPGSNHRFAWLPGAETDVQASLRLADTGYGYGGPGVRLSGSLGAINGYTARAFGTGLHLTENTAGTLTSLGYAAYTVVTGEVVQIEASGSDLVVRVDGVDKISGTDTKWTSGQVGLWARSASDWTDFNASDLGGGGTPRRVRGGRSGWFGIGR